ncbi:MAG TPA: adenylyl-sulfate kinase [Alphaproteobacteria bacterium]|jgi:bifunctional enzyme CysN/CysC
MSPLNEAEQRALPIVVVGHVDHGKSTLVGRLLHDTNSLPEGRLAELRAMSERRGGELEWSFLLDALQLERDQGITVDTTQIWFATAKRRYVIIDAPGHKEFLRNMVTGASRAEAALLVVDAKQGLSEQSRRHAYLLRLLGIEQVAVAVNKMDLVGHDEARFAEIAGEVRAYLAGLGLAASAVVPVSARHGDNVAGAGGAGASAAMPWYAGPSVVAALDGFAPRPLPVDQPLRLPLQDVYRLGDKRVLVGRIESGRLAVGDALRVNPTGRVARVAGLEDWNRAEPRRLAMAGDSVALALDEDVFAERGHLLSSPAAAPIAATCIAARVFWLDEEPLAAGRRLQLRIGTREIDATVVGLEQSVSVEDLAVAAATSVERGGVATALLHSAVPFSFDRFQDNPATGRGVLLANGRVAGGFIVDRAVQVAQQRNLTAVASSVTRAERERANGHRGGVIWLTGLSGAGKSTVANAALRRLFDAGWQAQFIDADNMRAGLSTDLGFSRSDRSENIRRVAHVAKFLAEGGTVALVALITPLRSHREVARAIAGEDFHEIYVSADLATCRARDPKGLYRLAAAREISAFTGLASPYEPPLAPDLVLDTRADDAERSAAALVGYIRRALGPAKAAEAQPGSALSLAAAAS